MKWEFESYVDRKVNWLEEKAEVSELEAAAGIVETGREDRAFLTEK